ncbi:MAG: phage baseplate assembly protein V [Aquisalimonadaceae bacterium]
MGGLSGRQLQRVLAPIWRRVRLLISRGEVRRTDEGRRMRRLQATLLRGETAEMEHMEPYGVTARPLPGAEVIAAAIGAARSHLVALLTPDRRHRPTDLSPGEVCLYTDEGDQIRLKRGRVIAVTAGATVQVSAPAVTVTASSKVTLETPITEITGDLHVGGSATVGEALEVAADATIIGQVTASAVSAQGDIAAGGALSDSAGDVQTLRNTYNTHTHDFDDGEGGTFTTDEPNEQL